MRRVVGVRTSPCGRRAQAIRLYCGYSEIKKFCEEFLDGEASPARWGHVERGVIPFSFGLIGILKTKIPAIDTEWLRAGAEDKMPVGLLRDLKKILDDPAQFWAV
jgi:hypothetical protein